MNFETLKEKLAHDAKEGLIRRIGEARANDAHYADRLNTELKTINDMDLAGYYLMIAEIINAAKDRDIAIGHCRSMGGSLVAWALRITEIDPLKYGLMFERFLNLDRPSLLNIDIEVSYNGRNELMKIFKEPIITQHSMASLNFIELRSLSIIEEVLRKIELAGKPVPDLERIPLDDPKTYQLLREADTLSICQLESDGMRRMIKKMQIDCFEDIIAALAMYRPGPLKSGMVDQYIKSKNGKMEVVYLHPMLKEVLEETYGVILYQEQIMQMISILAGYSLGEADLLRREMGRCDAEITQQERVKFVSACERNGIKSDEAEKIFDTIQKFAGYSISKSQSTAYALISYQTAWLKANFPTEFMAVSV